MYYCLTSLLLVVASYRVSAYPQVRVTDVPSPRPSAVVGIGPKLIDAIDGISIVAESCFLAQASRQFPNECAEAATIECHCKQYGNNGLTLGEMALSCYDNQEGRTNSDEALRTRIYNVCSSIPNRVPPNRTARSGATPTPTALSSGAFASPTPTSRISVNDRLPTFPTTGLFATARQSSMFRIPDVSASTLLVDAETALPISGAGSSDAAIPSTQRPMAPLSTAQIVGISVAGAAALMLGVGLIVAATCIRQRRNKKTEPEIFYQEKRNNSNGTMPNDGLGALRPLHLPAKVLKDPRGGAGGVGIVPVQPAMRSGSAQSRRSNNDLPPLQTGAPRLQLTDAGSNSRWINPDIPAGEIGLAISPESVIDDSPGSLRSTRTLSRLLPAKPMRPESSGSALTMFEEDAARRSMRQSQVPAMPPPAAIASGPLPPFPAPATIPYFPPPPTTYAMSPESYTNPRTPPQRQQHQLQSPFKTPLKSPPQSPPVPIPSPLRPVKATQRQITPPTATPESSKQPRLSLSIPSRSRAGSESSTPAPSEHSRKMQRHPSPPKPLPRIPGAKDDTASPLKVFVPPVYADIKPSPKLARNLSASSRSSLASSRSSLSSDISTPNTYVPRYYTSTRPSPQSTTKSPANNNVSRPKQSPKLVSIRPPNSAKSTSSRSRSTSVKPATKRDSTASYTSIESASDEPTPPSDDEDKQLQLASVPESPGSPHSPISGLRYPKVPRASNQLVPRSPIRSANGTQPLTLDTAHLQPSLLAKRRGDLAAQDLQGRLFVSPISSSVRSSAYTHSRSNSNHIAPRNHQKQSFQSGAVTLHSRTASDMTGRSSTIVQTNVEVPIMMNGPLSGGGPLNSALWLPRITPTRRGDDLFLSIE